MWWLLFLAAADGWYFDMSSTINATTVGVGGVVTTADNSGILVLQTASTTALTISAAQGVTLAGTLGVSGATTLSTTLGVTGVTTIAAGTALLPALTTTGDTNTGFWFPAADTLAWSTAGSERLRIDSSGNVGIGTSAPAKLLSVQYPHAKTDTASRIITVFKSNDASNALELSISALGAATQASRVWLFQTAENSISNAGTISLQSSGGNVGIGTESTLGGKLAIYGTASGSNNFIQITNPGQGTACLGLTTTGSNVKFYNCYSSGTLSTGAGIDIDTGGNLLVGTTSNLASTTRVSILSTGDGSRTQIGNGYAGDTFGNTSGTANYNALLFYNNNFASLVGYISVSGSTTSYVTSSDYRLKNTIAPMTGALDKVALLKPCTYKWNVDGSDGQGFIAHELAEVVPGCVTGEKDATREEEYEISPAVPAVVDADGAEITPAAHAIKGTRTVPAYQGVDTSFLVATLTAAIQEQQAIIETLTARITALETL